MKSFIVLCLLFIIGAQAEYEFSPKAKKCVEEINSDESTIRSLVKEDAPFPEDNELVQKFFGCIFSKHISDANQLVVDDKLMNYVTNILKVRMGGKRMLAELVANACIDYCKDVKGGNKGATAVKVMNCLKGRFYEYIEQ